MKNDPVYLQHIRDAAARILDYTSGGRAAFERDSKIQDAVIRNLEIIGEAVKHLSENFRKTYPEVPWKRIAGMRDELIHEYFGVDLEIVWNAVERDLPALKKKIEQFLKERS